MSPFSSLLYDLRTRHGVRQVELARRIGCDQSYISALEYGAKGPPTPEFLDRLIAELTLSEVEASELRGAVTESHHKFVIERVARPDVFKMVSKLHRRTAMLSPLHVQLIDAILETVGASPPAGATPSSRLAHRAQREAQM